MTAGAIKAGFHWHPQAMIAGWSGRARPMSVIPARPGADAIAAAMARAGQGLPFRIGATDAPAPDGPGFETLTSGSSGTPRRIRRSFASWSAGFAVNARLFGIGPGTRLAVLGHPDQSLSLYGAIEGLTLGAIVHLLADLRPDRQRRALADQAVGLLYATPAQLRLMVECGGPVLPALRHVLIGGSKLDPALRTGLQQMAPQADLREFYGAAETSFVTLADATMPGEAVGAAYPGVEIRVDGASGNPGTLWVRSPYLFDGYAGAETGGAIWRDGWLSVGEVGRLQDGLFYLSGRAGRMVTVADQNVFPEEVETFLLSLPGITRAAILPRPDALRGHVLIAVLAGDPRCEGAVLAALRARLGPTRAPKAVIWRQNWPALPSGKTDLRALEAGL